MHLVIKDDNSRQSLLGFPDLNLILNLHLTDMASCNLIKRSLIYSSFHKDLLITKLQILHAQSPTFIKFSCLEHEIFCFAKRKSILHVLYVNNKH